MATSPTSDRLTILRQKLASREGKPEYKFNVVELRKEIAKLEAKANG